MKRAIVAVLCLVMAAAGAAAGAPPAAEAAGAPPAAEAPAAPRAEAPAAQKISATVRSVEGTVEWRPQVGAAWAAVQVGQKLQEGADLRTGFRAACVLDMFDSLVRVEALTVARIGELRREDQTVRTRLYVKHGSTQAAVEKGEVPSDFAIVTPSATLAVRGTRTGKVQHFQDTGTQFALTRTGAAQVANLLGKKTLLEPGQGTNDQVTQPIEYLYLGQLLPLMDPQTFSEDEMKASGRRNGMWPWPFGPDVGPYGDELRDFQPPEVPEPIPPNGNGNGERDGEEPMPPE